jgi:FlaA1/EpsC-like NDP-sugar epimerase
MPPSALPPMALPAGERRTWRLLAPSSWSRLRFVMDLLVLYIATAAAMFVDGRSYARGGLILAACFPLVGLLVLRGHSGSAERLKTTFFDVISAVVGAVSLTAMLLIAVGTIFGVDHPLGLLVREWLYCAVYLSVARYMLVVVRRRALAVDSLATPTLIIGAGVIAGHLANRLLNDASYGLRPVGLLDPDPLQGILTAAASPTRSPPPARAT